MPLYGFFQDHTLTFTEQQGHQCDKQKNVTSKMVLECLKTAHKARKKNSGRYSMTRIWQFLELLHLEVFSELLTCTKNVLFK